MSHTLDFEARLARARQTLEAAGQSHVLAHYEALDEVSRHQLLAQIEGVDWPEVARLIQSHVRQKPQWQLPGRVEPAPWYPYQPVETQLVVKYEEARALGETLLREGKVAAFTVAGGQGTRLGWDGPKGTFPATPIRQASLFACFAEYLLNIQERFSTVVPWYVMTSPINHADTELFFRENAFFGLDEAHVRLFPQAMLPAIDMTTGQVLMNATDSLALSPNGHGGSLKALWTSGAIADMKERGIEQISYTQVDNPIVRMIDPLFIGLHALDGAQMSSKMLPKVEPLEKLGNFCLVDGRVTVIEYSNLPDDLAHERLETGELRFRAGSIALHAIRVDFVESLNTSPQGFSLPWNRAEKKVPFIDEQGMLREPKTPNAVKLETFVFDALPLCETSIVYETDRADEFAPIKNASGDGVTDSPATSHRMQIDRARGWLSLAGVPVAEDAVVEISQKLAIYPEDLQGLDLPESIGSGERFLLA